jgi:tetratricopeptide (TPR) repeat protein
MESRKETALYALAYSYPTSGIQGSEISWFRYLQDLSLVEYNANLINDVADENATKVASKIRSLADELGYSLDEISNTLYKSHDELIKINKGLSALNEAQETSNIYLSKIVSLMRVPDSEKERIHVINQALKFLANVSADVTYYEDAFEYFQKALGLSRQDPFVHYHLGLIHTYARKYFDLKKAQQYFLNASKYSIIKFDDPNLLDHPGIEPTKAPEKYKLHLGERYICSEEKRDYLVPLLSAVLHKTEDECQAIADRLPCIIAENLSLDELCRIEDGIYEFKKPLYTSNSIDTHNSNNSSKDSSPHYTLTARAYANAALVSYLMGDFREAVEYQQMSYKYDPVDSAYDLARYLSRLNDSKKAELYLAEAIKNHPIYVLAASRDMDLVKSSEIVNLLRVKNREIIESLKEMKLKWLQMDDEKSSDQIKMIDEAFMQGYDVKHEVLGKTRIRYQAHVNRKKRIKEYNNAKNAFISELGIKTKELDAFLQQFAAGIQELSQLSSGIKNYKNKEKSDAGKAYDKAKGNELVILFQCGLGFIFIAPLLMQLFGKNSNGGLGNISYMLILVGVYLLIISFRNARKISVSEKELKSATSIMNGMVEEYNREKEKYLSLEDNIRSSYISVRDYLYQNSYRLYDFANEKMEEIKVYDEKLNKIYSEFNELRRTKYF